MVVYGGYTNNLRPWGTALVSPRETFFPRRGTPHPSLGVPCEGKMSIKAPPPDLHRGESISIGMKTSRTRVAEAFRFRASSGRSPVAPYSSTVRAPDTAQPKDGAVTCITCH